MEITFIKEVKYCCKDMKELMNFYDHVYYKNKKLVFEFYNKKKGFFGDTFLDATFDFCPFCGEKVNFLKFVLKK